MKARIQLTHITAINRQNKRDTLDMMLTTTQKPLIMRQEMELEWAMDTMTTMAIVALTAKMA